MKERRKKPKGKSGSRSAKWHRANSAKAGSSPRPAKVRQGLIPGAVAEHDEKIIRAAEDWRQATGALDDARREVREAEAHLIGLLRKKGKTTWRDADGTLVTVRESKPKPTVNVDKVIPVRETPPPSPKAPASTKGNGAKVDESPYCECGHSHGAHESKNGNDHRCLAPECKCAEFQAKVEPVAATK